MRNRTALYILAILLSLALVTSLGVAVYQSRRAPGASSSTSTSSPSTPPSENGSRPAGDNTTGKTYIVSVYFSKHPESDDDPSRTFPVPRSSPDPGVAAFAVRELLKGPTATEQAKGYFTTVRLRDDTSTCGSADFTLSIASGTAKVQFCKPFDHLGVVADGQAESELKATLLQFATINRVILLNSQGNCEFNLSGLNLCQQ